jgi:hypothetical protein
VQKNDRRAIGGASFGVSDIEDAGIDLLQRAEGRICSRLDRRDFCLDPLCRSRTDHPELRGGDGHRGGAKEAASILVDFVRDLDRIHWAASKIGRFVADQPNVKAKASTPGPKNSISNCRSAMGPGCRIS